MSKKKNETAAAADPASFEEALRRLEEIVSKLEHGEAPLETALTLYEEGVGLARFCSGQVREAERRVMMLEDKNGELTSRPFSRAGDSARLLPDEDEEPEDEEDESQDDEDDGEVEDVEENGAAGRENQKRLF